MEINKDPRDHETWTVGRGAEHLSGMAGVFAVLRKLLVHLVDFSKAPVPDSIDFCCGPGAYTVKTYSKTRRAYCVYGTMWIHEEDN